ncbi:serine/threonine-protein kinase PLK1 isoform X1 [Carcharodon carcharias]|uniref:serine/threonine-protein kinase PLK1 isoform X1 n=1 Tax=Carcharodon carcharias TaxID=13397 RepID=UPI001B7E0329|nr:serine/threonine-protein kinase PLK1 isoform X1 [Carcharodon carcharias]
MASFCAVTFLWFHGNSMQGFSGALIGAQTCQSPRLLGSRPGAFKPFSPGIQHSVLFKWNQPIGSGAELANCRRSRFESEPASWWPGTDALGTLQPPPFNCGIRVKQYPSLRLCSNPGATGPERSLFGTLFFLPSPSPSALNRLKMTTVPGKPSAKLGAVAAPVAKEIPDILVNPKTMKRYVRGRFLGKGGFAKCYEISDIDTKEVFAGKIVPKTLLMKPHQREKMSMEISIHKSLNHANVVGFHGFFEDDDFVYVVLELCRRRSLLELHKRRKAVTEPEARYYLKQIILGGQYLHDNHVIHRDLKLGNLFLNDEMEVKIGDFGLATTVQYEGERKKTLCGTPNYIAPEVIGKKGHSFEVDVWSLGCIMYTLLVGKPPFETSCLKETYLRIKKNEYNIPKHVNPVAASLIQKMLRSDPSARPNIHELLNDEFFTSGYLPVRLPTTCLTMAPRFSLAPGGIDSSMRRPLTELNKDVPAGDKPGKSEDGVAREVGECNDFYLSDLLQQLNSVVAARPADKAVIRQEEAEDPACIPIFWVSKWVDYSDKYGLGYQLCDNSVGVLFNDSTRLIMYNDGESLQYIERDMTETYLNFRSYPPSLSKKATLLKYFRNYMSEHLLKAGANITPREGDELARLPFLRIWFRTRSAIVLHLSNGTVQINFFQDHTKIILCPLMNAVTYIDEKREFHTFKLSMIEEHGCCKELASRLRYARTMVEKLLTTKSVATQVKHAT